MPMPTREEQMQHAIQQAAIRYRGLKLTETEYVELCQKVQYGNGTQFVLTQNPGREVWSVPHNGKKLTAVFDTRRQNIVTFLPNGCHNPGMKTGNDRR